MFATSRSSSPPDDDSVADCAGGEASLASALRQELERREAERTAAEAAEAEAAAAASAAVKEVLENPAEVAAQLQARAVQADPGVQDAWPGTSGMSFPSLPGPDAKFEAGDVVTFLLDCLQRNDAPFVNAGLRTVYRFCTPMITKALGTEEDFNRDASQSVFAATVNNDFFEVEPINVVPSTSPTSPSRASQISEVVSQDGRRRRFLWMLVQERRPPFQGCWLVDGCIASEVDGDFDPLTTL